MGSVPFVLFGRFIMNFINKIDGRIAVIVMGVWMIIKGVLNLIFGGFSAVTLGNLVITTALVVMVYIGIPFMNYVAAGFIGTMVLYYLPGNLRGFHIFYLLEGVIDLVACVLLVFNREIREHCRKDNGEE